MSRIVVLRVIAFYALTGALLIAAPARPQEPSGLSS